MSRAHGGAKVSIDGLSPAKRALLQARLAAREASRRTDAEEGLLPRAGLASAPLSYAQRRLWLLDRFHPGLAAYNVGRALRIRGALDAGALERALSEILARHAVLRSAIVLEGEVPVQRVLRHAPMSLPLARVGDANGEDVQRLIVEEVRRPFDLAAGRLLRGRLWRLGEADHLLVLTTHHIASDEGSREVLFTELGALYEAFRDGRPSPLAALELQYGDYAAWQRGGMSDARLDAELGWWRTRLAGAPAELELPHDRPRRPVPSYEGARLTLTFDERLLDGLRELARSEGVTLFMVLLAAFQALLARLSGQDDVVVGAPISGRSRPELAPLVGLFANTLVLRCDCSGDPTFLELLGRVREAAVGAYAHQEVPFDRLVEDLAPRRDLSRHPLFQVLFNFIEQPSEQAPALAGLQVEPVEFDPGVTKFDLALVASVRGGGLRVLWEYSSELFEEGSVVALAGRFRRVLEGVVADPGVRVSRLALLSGDERRGILGRGGGVDVAVEGVCVHELVARRALSRPDAVAVRCAGDSLSYGELVRRASRVARELRGLGVAPGVLVGVYLDRSVELLVGLLGVLWAGGAYVPLDPSYPAERLGFMVEDAGVGVLLTRRGLRGGVSGISGGGSVPGVLGGGSAPGASGDGSVPGALGGGSAPGASGDGSVPGALGGGSAPGASGGGSAPGSVREVVCVDDPALERHSSTVPPSLAGPGDLAYVIYTSGSTGRPKGVMIEHRNLSNLLTSMATEPGLGPRDTLLAVTTFSFDIAAFELFGPLTVGGRVVIAPDATSSDPERLLELLGEDDVTVLQATPSLWRMLIEAGLPAMANLRAVCGGEALSPELAGELLSRTPSVWNFYGPTETTVWSACWRVGELGGVVPIGRPIANTSCYVLDGVGELVAGGVVGELYIGGEGVGRGYLGAGELTARRFLADPFRGGGRMYRTGDLARWRRDGLLEFRGRSDDQVKLRGFRIELGEVEAVLARHPGVSAAVAHVREDVPGDRRLVGYVVGDAPVGELMELAGRYLPEHMVPGVIVALGALPLTANGKLDRGALPVPGSVSRDATAPRTPLEVHLHELWREVLGVQEIGIHDSFFALGGHSLLVTRLVGLTNAALGVSLPMRAPFEAPTIAQLAELISSTHPNGQIGPRPPDQIDLHLNGQNSTHPNGQMGTQPNGQIGTHLNGQIELPAAAERPRAEDAGGIERLPRAAPASSQQRRLWFLDRLRQDRGLYNIPLCLRITGPLDAPALRRALDQLVVRHEALRVSFAEEDGAPVQVVGPPEPFALCESRADSEAQGLALAHEEASRPFDLATGPLARARLIELSPREHILAITFHHAVADGWSLGLLADELGALYGRSIKLAPPELQYPDYAVRQRDWLREGTLEAELSWWRARLAGAPSELELPSDRPRPVEPTGRGARYADMLDGELLSGLERLAGAHDATLFMVLLSAFDLLLARLSGQDDVVVGVPVSGRMRPELEGVFGYIANTLVLRCDCSGDPTFLELLGRVREAAVGAYAHQEVPFDRLVEDLAPQRDLSRHPLFQVLLTLQDDRPAVPVLGGAEVELLEVDRGVSRFDLSASCSRRGGGLRVLWEYSSELFEEGSVVALAGRFRRVLEGVVADPGVRVSRLALLSGDERRGILGRGGGVDVAVEGVCVHELVARRALSRPDAVAVRCAGDSLSYGELVRRASRVARELRGLGVAPGVLVGVYLDRSVELLVGLLGVLWAGGAYVPLDPSYPAERLGFMVEDAGVGVLLTRRGLRGGVSGISGGGSVPGVLGGGSAPGASGDGSVPGALGGGSAPGASGDGSVPGALGGGSAPGASGGGSAPGSVREVVCVDDPALERHSSTVPPSLAGPGDLAYVIYTSGSTGRPKGVMIEHRNLSNLLTSMATEPGLGPGETMLGVTTPAFDLSVPDLYLPLTTGATLLLAGADEAGDPRALARLLEDGEVSLMQATPSTWRMLLDDGWTPSRPMRAVVGGEALAPALAAELRDLMEGVWNFYGPTETTVWSACWRVGELGGVVPIGRPIANTSCYVLDGVGELVAGGVVGELYIGGEGVGRGYLGAGELTARRFLADPFRGGGRMYRTGDLARWRRDGLLEFRGRSDDQVKLRGFRIELGEVEAVLARHPGVSAAVAHVREDVPGDRRLVGYVVGDAPVGELMELAGRYLPEHMVPGVIVALGALPLTANGKLDRGALPVPGSVSRDATAPRTPLEVHLHELWREVLGVQEIGIHDSFFALGGHSLLVTKVLARVRDAFGVELSLRRAYEAPSIAAMAQMVASALVDTEDRAEMESLLAELEQLPDEQVGESR